MEKLNGEEENSKGQKVTSTKLKYKNTLNLFYKR
jgi:hypothetical protein